MLFLFSAEEVTGAFPSQVWAVCVKVGETKSKGRGSGRESWFVSMCRLFKQLNLFRSCRISVTYPGDTQSRDLCLAGWEGELFFKLLNFQACQPAFNQFGVCHVEMCVMFGLLHQNFLSQKIKHLLQNWNWMALFYSSVCMTDPTGIDVREWGSCVYQEWQQWNNKNNRTYTWIINQS